MNILNSVAATLVDFLFEPVKTLPALVSLIIWSSATGVLVAVVYCYASNQGALRTAAARTRAQLFAVKLFKDDLRVTLRAQGELLKATGQRLWYSLPPMLVLIAPVVILLAQLARWYEYRPLSPNESAVVQLQLKPSAWESAGTIALEVPAGMVVETPPLRDAALRTVYWRVRPTTVGANVLRWQIDGQSAEKRIAVADPSAGLLPVSPRRPGPGWFDRLLHPGEPGFSSDSRVQGIDVQHARRSTPVFGFDVPWWLMYFVVSILSALLVRPWLGIQY